MVGLVCVCVCVLFRVRRSGGRVATPFDAWTTGDERATAVNIQHSRVAGAACFAREGKARRKKMVNFLWAPIQPSQAEDQTENRENERRENLSSVTFSEKRPLFLHDRSHKQVRCKERSPVSPTACVILPHGTRERDIVRSAIGV